jgi:hypothetical protein
MLGQASTSGLRDYSFKDTPAFLAVFCHLRMPGYIIMIG